MLTFVTVNTGSSMTYARSAVPDMIVHHTRNALQNDGILWNGWSVRLHHASETQARFDLLLDNLLVTHCWLCRCPDVARQVWQDVIDADLPWMRAQRPEAVPWLAVGMAIDSVKLVLQNPRRLFEAPSAEVSIAWALLES